MIADNVFITWYQFFKSDECLSILYKLILIQFFLNVIEAFLIWCTDVRKWDWHVPEYVGGVI